VPAAPDVDPLSVLSRLEALGIKLGLERARALLVRMGDPQRRFPAVLIAGTNGKGSTSAFLAAIAQAAGYRTGLYTSPHLEFVEERLRIDGRMIEPGRFGRILEDLVGLAERETGVPPTYFEAVTLAAFQWFAEERVDLAVVEVGLGGRLDATNLCDPILSLITPIGFDHQEYLGDTLAAIAREKAGILRSGKPALVWAGEPEAADSIREAAAGIGADLRFVPEEVRIEAIEPEGWTGQRVRLATPVRSYDLQIALLGAHQAINLGLAVRAAETLVGLGFDRIDPDAIQEGAAACRWPAGGDRSPRRPARPPRRRPQRSGRPGPRRVPRPDGAAGRPPLRRAGRQGLPRHARPPRPPRPPDHPHHPGESARQGPGGAGRAGPESPGRGDRRAGPRPGPRPGARARGGDPGRLRVDLFDRGGAAGSAGAVDSRER
jgi:dihydrofolate synthase/folylpolyglutamate synthase